MVYLPWILRTISPDPGTFLSKKRYTLRRVIAPKFDTKECAKMKRWTRMLAILLSLMMLLSLSACGEKPADPLVRELLGEETMAIVQKDFPSPLEYYRAVEQRRAQELLSFRNLTEYASALQDGFTRNEILLSLDHSALEQDLRDYLTESAGMDLSWLKSLGFGYAVGMQEDLRQVDMILRLNDTDLLSLTGVVDPATMDMFLSVPLLNEDWLQFNYLELAERIGAPADLQELSAAMTFSPEGLSSLILRYHELVLNNVEKVELTDGTASAGGIENKCSIASVKLEGEDLQRVAKVLLDAAEQDEELEKLAYFIAGRTEEFYGSEEDFHQYYVEWIQSTRENLESTTPEDKDKASVLMDVYIDPKGEIQGRRLEIHNDGETDALFSYLITRDGDKLGLESEFSTHSGISSSSGDSHSWSHDNEAAISGSGSLTQEGKLSGSFLIRAHTVDDWDGKREELDIPVFTANVDGSFGREGFLGDVELIPTQELLDKACEDLGEDTPEPVLGLMRSLTLFASNRSTQEKLDLRCVLRSSGKDLLTLTVLGESQEPFAITAPAESVDLDTWVGSIGLATLSKIMNKLMEAGMPSSILNGILG